MGEELADSVHASASHRLGRINLVSAVSSRWGPFFALGALLAQLATSSRAAVNITYLVGGVFFSLGAYASILLIANSAGVEKARRLRWWTPPQHSSGWRGAVVLFAGTLLLAVSLIAAFAEGLTPRQSNGWIWFPDMLGWCASLSRGTSRCSRSAAAASGCGYTASVGGWWPSTSSVPSCSFSPAWRRWPVRQPLLPSTSAWSTGGRSPVRSVSQSAGSLGIRHTRPDVNGGYTRVIGGMATANPRQAATVPPCWVPARPGRPDGIRTHDQRQEGRLACARRASDSSVRAWATIVIEVPGRSIDPVEA